MKKSK